jgi:Beta-galactosidase
MKFGTTFSEPYAESLGLDPRPASRAIARDLGLQTVRLCTNWDRTEPEPGRFDFRSLDWQVDEATKAGLEIILTVGQKAPRWPEYHRPAWTSPTDPAFGQHLFRFIESTVTRFQDAPVSVWQVENEPYVVFGGPQIDEVLLRRETDLVRSLDARPIMLTESADKGDWRRTARWCDILGVNLYTRHWGRGRYVDIEVRASRYAARIREVSSSVSEVVVSELQAEPWGPKPVHELTASEAALSMNPKRLRRNVELARNAGFTTALLWGAEWWYWLWERGDPSMWEAAVVIIEDFGDP